MPRKGCMCNKRVGFFSPDISEREPVSIRSILDPEATDRSRLRSHKQIPAARTSLGFRQPARLFRCVRVNLAKALGLLRKRPRRPSAKGSSNMVAPHCYVPPRDSLHSETLEECIEFINSSYRKSI